MGVTTEKKRERKEGVVEEPFERGRWWLCSMGSLRRKLRREERDDGGRAAGTNALGLLREAAHERGEAERSTRYAMY